MASRRAGYTDFLTDPFSIENAELASMRQAHVGRMLDSEAQAFVDKYSSLYGEGEDHNLQYISRPTARGVEHYFAASVFDSLRWD